MLPFFLAAENLDSALASATVRAENGKIVIAQDGKNLSLSGKTPEKKGNKYFYSSIYFKTPLDLKGKSLEFDAATKFPAATQAIYLRFFNKDESKPTLSYFSWSSPLSVTPKKFSLTRYQDSALKWESSTVGNSDPGAVTRLQIWIGSNQDNADIDLTMSNLRVVENNDHGNWTKQPVYADKAADVKHPSGPIKAEDVMRGRNNVKQYEWARKQLAEYREKSKILMALDPRNLEKEIPMEDPWLQCPCPRCGEHADRAWNKGLNQDGNTINCVKCGQVLPSADFPEDKTYTAITSHGHTKTIKYHEGKTSYYGNQRQHISGIINWMRVSRLFKLHNLGYVYALTGEEQYAKQVRSLLLRFAEAYPEYVVRFRTTAYATPLENNMASKVADWKFQDSSLVINLAIAYDLTVGSGLYSDADRLKIENGIFREYQWLITAHAPTSDWCSNAVPAHMTAAALCAAMTGDHNLMKWVMEGSEGFKSFIQHNYHRDGFWNENSASYALMANQPLLQLLDTLHNYSDAPEYNKPDRYDKLDIFRTVPETRNIFSCEGKTVMPDGNLPPTNDSCFGEKIPQSWLEFNFYHFPTPENLAMLQSGLAATAHSEYSLFKRQTQLTDAARNSQSNLFSSRLVAGPCWAILRPDNNKNNTALLFNYGPFTGGHAHNSALNFSYYDDQRELITDLGYMRYTHPLRPWMISPLAHNLVVVDGKPQSDQRAPQLNYFSSNNAIKIVAASAPEAYPGITKEYSRTMMLIPLKNQRYYAVDFFRVRGGKEHVYAIHGDSADYTTSLPESDWKAEAFICGDAEKTGSKWLKDVKTAVSEAPFTVTWKSPSKVNTRMFWCNDQNNHQLFMAQAPGSRDPNKPYDIKNMIAVFMSRVTGPMSDFAAVFEAFREQSQIDKVNTLNIHRGTGRAIEVTHGEDIDIIMVNYDQEPLELEAYPSVRLDGGFGVIRINKLKVVSIFLGAGKSLSYGKEKLENAENLSGQVTAIGADRKTVEIKVPSSNGLCAGKYLVFPKAVAGTYKIDDVKIEPNKVSVILAADEVINFKAGDRFVIFNSISKQY